MVFHAVELASLLAALAVLIGVRIKPPLAWSLVAVGLIAFAAQVSTSRGGDLQAFWNGGRNLWGGRSPYEPNVRIGAPIPLNPPTAFPMFAALAVLPFRTCLVAWNVLNAACCLALVWISTRALHAEFRGTDARWEIDPPTLGVLTTAVSLSFAARYGIELGQLAVLTAVLLIGAIWARATGRWLTAAVLLSLATIKIGSMLPFLLLFLDRRHRSTLGALVVICLVLTLSATPMSAVVARLREMTENIERLGTSVNNYEYKNSSSVEILGIDHTLYRLGMRGRSLIRLVQGLLLAALGAWLAWEVRPRGRLPRGAVVSLIAIYACLFLYHRNYDTVVLALPLVYAVGRARVERGRMRLLSVATGVAVLNVMYLQVGLLRKLTRIAARPEILDRVIRGSLLPYGT